MEGPLLKWTNVMKGWQYRWFILDDDAGLLSYYTSKDKMMRGARRGCVRLKGAIIGIEEEAECTFTITVDGKIFHFKAKDSGDSEKWIRALEDTILRHGRMTYRYSKRPLPTLEDFDRRMSEADAYLQILIEQVKTLDQEISKAINPVQRNAAIHLKEKGMEMLEGIKHSIIVLQIAKNTVLPLNGVYSKPPPQPTDHLTTLTKVILEPDAEAEPGIEGAREVTEEMPEADLSSAVMPPKDVPPSRKFSAGHPLSHKGSPPKKWPAPVGMPSGLLVDSVLPGDLVPETSYSSSEDEDFFDATEDQAPFFMGREKDRPPEPVVPLVRHRKASTSLPAIPPWSEGESTDLPPGAEAGGGEGEGLTHVASVADIASPVERTRQRTTSVSVDDDALYEDGEEDDLGSMEQHGSVVMHLLSQVKIGMDLTKVVLPTFILERRSLLEMYADFFAHPQLFLSIPDAPSPQERLVAVLRWYLSAFHAGRKSEVAKKPYNPILGETFSCAWTVPEEHKGTPLDQSDPVVHSRPAPWSRPEQLSCIAEQVSHHPPVSAFYAEHIGKRVSLCGHIYTKSKFLGLSIGVHNVGQAVISLLNRDEEYIVNFPSAYGRSILTVPWIELGGSCSVTCEKTGYYANVEFHTKPFYGGKKHRVTAEAFAPNSKRPFLRVDGEWNGVIRNTADGSTFVDTHTVPIINKEVAPISQQSEMESRRLWRHVTLGLKEGDIEGATRAKQFLEQRQRNEAKERKDKGETWETKQFSLNGETWLYNTPLQRRLLESVKK